MTLLHELGHAMAMRALGGRAGRLIIRYGWPWAVTEVGPWELLPPTHALFVVSAGLIIEIATLGLSLAVMSLTAGAPATAAIPLTAAIQIAFNLSPLSCSDGRRLLNLVVNRIISI